MDDYTEKGRSDRRWLIVLILFIVIAAAAAITLAVYLLPRFFRHPVEQPSYIESATASGETVVLVQNPIDFESLWAENEDVVAWIKIPGTAIDYPVLQASPEEKESFYLDHGMDKQYRRAGCIYIQKMNAKGFTDPNTVLYGHYMANGSMFADLHQFRKDAFFAENEYAYVYTPGHILTYRIYSAFVYDDRHILYSFDFASDEGFSAFLNDTLHPASMARQVREGVEVTTTDRIISLSTCTMRDSERYLVEGVLISDQRTY